jgi:hypothetical protein
MDARRLTVSAVTLCAVVASPLALATSSTAVGTSGRAADPDGKGRLLSTSTHGRAAIAALGDDLDVAASRSELSVADLRDVLAGDSSAWVNPAGQLYYVEPTLDSADVPKASTTRDRSKGSMPYRANRTFSLHSKPGSDHTIYLDFDGQRVAGSIWNDNSALPDAFYPGWSTDADRSTFNASERATIQSIWQRVAEDYAPFDVDVTTDDPGADALTRSSWSDQIFGTRALFTQSTTARNAVCQGTCGGVAYVGTFDGVSSTPNYMQPAWIFPQGLGPNYDKFMAEAATHEVGHTLGLAHDGTSTQGYYAGQGSWAPIMGVGYGEPITQWSRGEYAEANNSEDDYAVMRSHGLPSRADEAGSTPATAAPLLGRSVSGFVTDPGDKDVYAVDRTCRTPFTASARPAPTSPDLDIKLTVLDESGDVVATDDPASGGSGDVATGLSAGTGSTSGRGTFFLEVDGVGHGHPMTTGYTDYGSVGRYTLSVSSTCTDGQTSGPRPGAPSRLRAHRGNHEVDLRWAAPRNAAAAHVDRYRVRMLGANGTTVRSTSLRAGARSLTWGKLRNGKAYRFSVTALSGHLEGRPSRVSSVVPARVPGHPGAVSASVHGYARGHVVHLRWSAPAADGGLPVTRYRITKLRLSAHGGVVRQIVTSVAAHAPRHDVRVPRTGRWAFRIRAVNAVGPGWSSKRSNVVLVP